ncbi:MAG: hypothetical protein ACRD9Q_03385, partial [Nitrososphaeraceae archaeon]
MAKSKTKSKGKNKKTLPKGMKTVGKHTGIMLPLPTFPQHDAKFLKDRVLEIAKLINRENTDMADHIKDKYKSPIDVWSHLYNTNLAIDRLLYLIIWLFHLESHDERGLEEFS